MTKEKFLKDIIDDKIKFVYKLKVGNYKLIKECGGEVNYSKRTLKENIKKAVTDQVLKAANKVNWKLFETDEEKFRHKFFNALIKIPLDI